MPQSNSRSGATATEAQLTDRHYCERPLLKPRACAPPPRKSTATEACTRHQRVACSAQLENAPRGTGYPAQAKRKKNLSFIRSSNQVYDLNWKTMAFGQVQVPATCVRVPSWVLAGFESWLYGFTSQSESQGFKGIDSKKPLAKARLKNSWKPDKMVNV